MKYKLLTVGVLTFLSVVMLSGSAQACDTCPPDPCTDCPPDESVPMDGGLALVLLGGAALGVKKMVAQMNPEQ